MESKTQHGYLVLADISGYTAYLAGTELDHAQEILTDLLEIIVGRLKTLLTIAKLEGDAVFAYGPEGKIERGETLLELIEATYMAFCDRRDHARRRTTCACNACRSISTLDLKFMTHHGDYVLQNVAGINELVGSDVNLIHRLLKNHVSEATGWRAYALFTDEGLKQMGVKPDGMHEQAEAYEYLGEVKTYSLDLRTRYKELTEARRVFISPEEADFIQTHELPGPPPAVWEWLTEPHKRSQWMGGRVWSVVLRPGGRTAPGARNHCVHGKNQAIETILDWRPFEYMTGEQVVGDTRVLETVHFEPTPDGRGTRVHDHIKMPSTLLRPRWLKRLVTEFIMTKVGKYKTDDQYAQLARLVAEEMAREQAAEAAPAS